MSDAVLITTIICFSLVMICWFTKDKGGRKNDKT